MLWHNTECVILVVCNLVKLGLYKEKMGKQLGVIFALVSLSFLLRLKKIIGLGN